MKAMILAAGRGERMRPLTEHTPKPLLPVGDKPLLMYHIEKLAALGIRDILINIAYLGHKIKAEMGNGESLGVSITYIEEPEPLETAGALHNALPLLGSDPFLLINGDVWTDFPFEVLLEKPLSTSEVGRLVFVENPEHHLSGDFSLTDQSQVIYRDELAASYTFSGMALLSPAIIADYPKKRYIFPLREVLEYAIDAGTLSGMVYQGQWWDVGTVERLQQVDAMLKEA